MSPAVETIKLTIVFFVYIISYSGVVCIET